MVLWIVLGFLKIYPKDGFFESLVPRQHLGTMHNRYVRQLVRKGVEHLSACMVEISMLHLLHVNNHVPHFPKYVVGSLDTFPLVVENGPNRYQPK